jgi:hypothetical protein
LDANPNDAPAKPTGAGPSVSAQRLKKPIDWVI